MVNRVKALFTERELAKRTGNLERVREINESLSRLAANAKTPAQRAARRITKGTENR